MKKIVMTLIILGFMVNPCKAEANSQKQTEPWLNTVLTALIGLGVAGAAGLMWRGGLDAGTDKIINKLAEKFELIENAIGKLDATIDKLSDKIDHMDTRVDNHDNRMSALETRSDLLVKEMGQLKQVIHDDSKNMIQGWGTRIDHENKLLSLQLNNLSDNMKRIEGQLNEYKQAKN